MAKTNIDELAIVLSASTAQLAGDLRAAAKLVDEYRREVNRAAPEVAAERAAAKEAAAHKAAAKEASLAWRGVTQAASFARAGVAGLAAGAGFAAAKAGIGGVGEAFEGMRESVNLAADLEQTTLAFEVMLKSGSKAAAMLADVRKFAAETPFNNTELTDASRKLIAYGVSGEQVIPTLRMLGDVAAATQTPIGDLSYLYGTLAAQQRAYSRDIFQFANRGIPIYEALSKVLAVSVSEVKDLVEEGRVGFPEVVRAFKSLTERGGLYAGLTARQADTFGGLREQLSDALQVGKIKLGQVLIDKLGLKDAARDLTKFIEGLDVERIGAGVKLVGDLARGGAQVAYQFAKAAETVLSMNFNGLIAVVPEFAALARDTDAFIKNLKNFELDEEQVVRFGLKLFNAVALPLADAADWINTEGRAYKDGFQQNFIDPVNEWVKRIESARDALEWVRNPGAKIGDALSKEILGAEAYERAMKNREELRENRRWLLRERLTPPGKSWLPDEFQPGGTPSPTDAALLVKAARAEGVAFHPPRADEPAESALFRWRHLNRMIGVGETLVGPGSGLKEYEPFLKSLKDIRDSGEFFRPFTADVKGDWREMAAALNAGHLPARRPEYQDPEFGPNAAAQESRRQMIERRASEWSAAQLNGLLAMKAAVAVATEAEKRAARETALAADAFAGLTSGAGLAAKELAMVKAPAGPEVPWALPPEVADAAKRAKEGFRDPIEQFVEEWNTLSKALLYRQIDGDVYNRASTDLIRRAEARLDHGPTQLPEAMSRGSEQATRALNQWMSQNQVDDTRGLLQRLVDFAARQEQRDVQARDRAALPIQIALPRAP